MNGNQKKIEMYRKQRVYFGTDLEYFLLCENCAKTKWCCRKITEKKYIANFRSRTTTMHCDKQWLRIKFSYIYTQFRNAASLVFFRPTCSAAIKL